MGKFFQLEDLFRNAKNDTSNASFRIHRIVIEGVNRKAIKNWSIGSKGNFAVLCATFAGTLRDTLAHSITTVFSKYPEVVFSKTMLAKDDFFTCDFKGS